MPSKGSETMKGAAGGAATGAAVGSLFGPGPGTAIGAGIGAIGGGIMGYLGGGPTRRQKRRKAFEDAIHGLGAGDFTSPHVQPSIDQRGMLAQQLAGRDFSQFRGNQQNYITGLEADVAGHGAGQELVRRQVGQQVQGGVQQQLAQQAAAGRNPLASRTAAMQMANISGQGGIAAGMGGLQAQLAARQQLGGALQGARGQDQAMFGLQQQGQLSALQQQLQLQRMQQQGLQAYQGARLGGMQALARLNQPDPASFGDRMLGLGVGAAEFIGSRPGKKTA